MDPAYNRFQASGSVSDLKDFIDSCCQVQRDGQLALDFARIIPMPTEVRGDDDRASDWSSEHWSTSWVVDFKTEKRTATHLILRFGSAGTPPENIYRELARRYPEIKFVANFAEGAYNLAHYFSAWRGDIVSTEREASDEDWEAATGETKEEREQSYEAARAVWEANNPPARRSKPIVNPRFWLRHRRVRRALVGYPLYDIPNKQEERTLDETRVQENFAHFMRVRLDRLTFFQNWLGEWFGVRATLNGDGLLALNEWVNAYGGGLIEDAPNTQTIFETYRPAWVDEYAGYNVMVDIGIFIGEYLISKRPQLHWEIYRGHPNGQGELTGPNLKRPQLGGFPRQWGDDVIGLGYGVIAGSRKRSHIGYSPSVGDPDGMIKLCKQSLYLANVPDDGSPFIFGDYSNEPI